MKFQAISILTPAVENIINGSKSIEIRSWYPETMPLKNVILVQNDKYLKNQSDIDHGMAMAIVDFVSVRNWSYEDYLKQNQETTLNKPWSPGYYVWEIKNVRILKKSVPCVARKGIYTIDLNMDYV
ncbi:ASCH domain-containing protein [Salmonella enterica subsp. enterica serovar Enteritidis]|uniref:ASCH domain-containing protein n=7 Tax=Salmonella enterica TaxID=28901 RepID=A0A3V1BWC1_SALET|nr:MULTISPECIES: ASCH domain-containing protein [Salmonella]EAA4385184.1 ASCH domain-containing protein [Salmonella enterica subsp. enterica serovar Agona]EAA6716068.1 ASCH domain-containing protein [Salmonella enterica subsp. enterica serovar Java]EBN3543069.1 ASCH domain-containing protein [Salmonella enterica subsp. enterica serovar Newport]EBS0944883.1 ASCH domain-containing protein [Salmonella enterica subsp. enterica serovar Senftenberg]EBU8349621.1 ASCH domain-containing protein [Salmon